MKPYAIGQRFKNRDSGKKYILAHIHMEENEVKLINLETGGRWSDNKTTVQDVRNIHPNEMELIFKNGDFVRVTS